MGEGWKETRAQGQGRDGKRHGYKAMVWETKESRDERRQGRLEWKEMSDLVASDVAT